MVRRNEGRIAMLAANIVVACEGGLMRKLVQESTKRNVCEKRLGKKRGGRKKKNNKR